MEFTYIIRVPITLYRYTYRLINDNTGSIVKWRSISIFVRVKHLPPSSRRSTNNVQPVIVMDDNDHDLMNRSSYYYYERRGQRHY